MKKHIFIIDDMPDEFLEVYLEENGFKVSTFKNGVNIIHEVTNLRPDLILLDLSLPGKSGFEILKDIIALPFFIPVIIISANDSTEVIVIALEIGAVDYFTKPLNHEILMAKLKVNLRNQVLREINDYNKYNLNDFVFDFENNVISRDGKQIPLTNSESGVLKFLLDNVGKILSREEIMLNIWGKIRKNNFKTIDNHISRLRKKVENDHKKPKYIISVYGRGYKFLI